MNAPENLPDPLPALGDNDGRPFEIICDKCKRRVDSWVIKRPIEADPFSPPDSYRQMRNTGEIIVTVECHGERWQASSWHRETQREAADLLKRIG